MIERVKLALEQRNYALASYLLKKMNSAQGHDYQTLDTIHNNPNQISRLKPVGLNSDFYLYGLKRLLTRNADRAIALWQQAKTREMLNEKQQQSFLTQVALYKATRSKPDARTWFAKIKLSFNNEALNDWNIRFALKNRQWADVESLINHATNKDSIGWQYWLARAMEAQGKREPARLIYQRLAKTRQYYGFLFQHALAPSFTIRA